MKDIVPVWDKYQEKISVDLYNDYYADDEEQPYFDEDDIDYDRYEFIIEKLRNGVTDFSFLNDKSKNYKEKYFIFNDLLHCLAITIYQTEGCAEKYKSTRYDLTKIYDEPELNICLQLIDLNVEKSQEEEQKQEQKQEQEEEQEHKNMNMNKQIETYANIYYDNFCDLFKVTNEGNLNTSEENIKKIEEWFNQSYLLISIVTGLQLLEVKFNLELGIEQEYNQKLLMHIYSMSYIGMLHFARILKKEIPSHIILKINKTF